MLYDVFSLDLLIIVFIKGTAHEVWWQNGYASDCKSAYVGSIPAQTSIALFPQKDRFGSLSSSSKEGGR